jgi:hypothetical protein
LVLVLTLVGAPVHGGVDVSLSCCRWCWWCWCLYLCICF